MIVDTSVLLAILLDEAEAESFAAAIRIEPVSLAQVRIARLAYAQYGKGRHPAGLNLGDCFAYALGQDRDEPLLFKGGDFRRTDLRAAQL